MFTLDLDTWLISDTHFGHGNIVQYSNRPQDHNEIMMSNWERLVGKDDVVLHLGDVAMTGAAAKLLYPRIIALPGKKYLLRGNHDTGTAAHYNRLGYEVLPVPRPSRSKNGMQGGTLKVEFCEHDLEAHHLSGCPEPLLVALSHTPCGKDLDWDINIHGHIHTNLWPKPMFDSGKDYRNICVEVIDYQPVRLRDVLFGSSYQPISAGYSEKPDTRLEYVMEAE